MMAAESTFKSTSKEVSSLEDSSSPSVTVTVDVGVGVHNTGAVNVSVLPASSSLGLQPTAQLTNSCRGTTESLDVQGNGSVNISRRKIFAEIQGLGVNSENFYP